MCGPLAGDRGTEPPIFFGLRPKKTGRSRSKRKALCVQILPGRAGLDEYGGRARRCPRNLKVSCRVRFGLGEQRGCFPAFASAVWLSGWSSDLAHFWSRAFRFAKRYRAVKGAAAKREAYQIVFAPRHTGQFVAGCAPASFSKTEPAPNANASHPRVGNPTGRGRGPFPLSRFKGVRGKIEIPPGFWWGCKGEGSFQKTPSPSPPSRPVGRNPFKSTAAR